MTKLSAIAPVTRSLRLQFFRSLLLWRSSIFIHRHTTPIFRAQDPKLDPHSSFPSIPTRRWSSLLPLFTSLDKYRQVTETHSNTFITGTYIFSSGSSRSSSDPTQSRSEWSHLCCSDGNGLRIPGLTCRDHLRSLHQLPYRSRSGRYGWDRSSWSHPRLEVSLYILRCPGRR